MNSSTFSVLIVDDQPALRQQVRANLAKMGFAAIDEAGNAEAETKIAAKRYDMLFLDRNMNALLKKLRADKAYDATAIIVTATAQDEPHMAEAMKSGATNYIIKPFMPAAFQARLEPVLDWLQKKN